MDDPSLMKEVPNIKNQLTQKKRNLGNKSLSHGKNQVNAAKKMNKVFPKLQTFNENMLAENTLFKRPAPPAKRPNPIFNDSPSKTASGANFRNTFFHEESHAKNKTRNPAMDFLSNPPNTKRNKIEDPSNPLKTLGEKIQMPQRKKEPVNQRHNNDNNNKALDADPISDSDNDDFYELPQVQKKPNFKQIQQRDALDDIFNSDDKKKEDIKPSRQDNNEKEIILIEDKKDDTVISTDNNMHNINKDTTDNIQNDNTKKENSPVIPSVGLRNTGNMCYMNSVLQALFHTHFSTDILSAKLGEESMDSGKMRLYSSLKFLFRQLKTQKNCAVSAEGVKNSIASYDSIFGSVGQQDAHEFLMCLLSNLQDEIASCLPRDSSATANIVSTNFSTVLRHEIACKECGKSISLDDSFLSISLDFPPPKQPPSKLGTESSPQTSIMALLEFFFKSNDLDHKCEGCGKSQATHAYTIKAGPRYLILHLKRWVYKGLAGLVKIRDKVNADPTLDLTRFFDDKSVGSSYVLRSVVSHKGDFVGNGHYITYTLGENAREWILFNDSTIQPCCPPPSQEENYILMYERRKSE